MAAGVSTNPKPFLRPALAALLLPLAFCLAGCARGPILGPGRAVRVALLDATLPEGHGEETREIVGWWLSAADVLRAPNDGALWSDALARELERAIPRLHVYPRQDLKFYMAAKLARLESRYPRMNDAERRRLLAAQDPLDFGRSLGVDFILTARVNEALLTHHRTFHWWTAYAAVEVDAWDVSRGVRVWSWREENRDHLSSVSRLFERMAGRCARSAGRAGVFLSVPAAPAGEPQPLEPPSAELPTAPAAPPNPAP